ncbi:MAG: (Fe-S)-binding protein [Firmicutes bacterium]|nr:(Fe-S)-binding protein [Bacillota bacterium]
MSGKASKTPDAATQTRLCALCPNMCRFLCPVAAAEKSEAVTPRGKATLALDLGRGALPLSEETAELLYRCAGCRACREWCPSGCDLVAVLEGPRAEAARGGLAPAEVRGVRDRLVRDRSLHGPAGELALRLERFRELTDPRAPTLYFPGCAVVASRSKVVEATLRLFEAAGEPVALPRREVCCGLPLDVLGYAEEATDFARGLAESVAGGGFATVVSGCPMCVWVMRERYPRLGVTLPARVVHTVEFLEELAAAGRLPPSQEGVPDGGRPRRRPAGAEPVTYHDPCYLGRYLGVYESPRRLLAEVAGLEVAEMDRTRELAACCGGSPALDFPTPATATAVGRRRLAEAARTGARTLVTACPHCLEMLSGAAEVGLEVRDLAEVLAGRLGLGEAHREPSETRRDEEEDPGREEVG